MSKKKTRVKDTQVDYYIMPVEYKDDPHSLLIIINKETIFKYDYFPICDKEPLFMMCYLTSHKKKVKEFKVGYKKVGLKEVIEYFKPIPIDIKLIKNLLDGMKVMQLFYFKTQDLSRGIQNKLF